MSTIVTVPGKQNAVVANSRDHHSHGATFTEYMKVLEENERLKNTIRMLLGGNDYNERFT